MSGDLFSQFIGLDPALGEDTFNAVSAHPVRGDFLGKSQNGSPVFLIADDGGPIYRPEIRHQHLRISFGMSCRLCINGQELTNQFAVIRFDGDSVELHEVFVRCVNAVMLNLPSSADTYEIENRVSRLLSLFQGLSTPSGREISGLWAELFCIRYSLNVEQTLSRWHSENFETYDFSWPGNRVEVKSTTTPQRVHEFSLEQLVVPSNSDGKVISMMLRTSNDGIGVMGMARAIEADLQGNVELREKLWSQVLQALGQNFSDALDRRFDADFALLNFAAIPMRKIPSVQRPSDPRISTIRFRVDLSDLKNLNSNIGASALQEVFR
jgi:Putative  PD-(D/E)XK family member, (DUF4420)